jgi:ribonuclease Z
MQVDMLGYAGSIQLSESSNTSLVVREADTSLLVDVSGSPCQALLQHDIDPNLLDAVLLTHAHVDHLYALPSLLHNLWMRNREKPLLIAGSETTLEQAKRLYRLFHLDAKPSLDSLLRWESVPSQIGSIRLDTFEVFHRPTMPTQGYTFTSKEKKVSYFPDSAVKKPYPACARHSDLIIHEVGGLDADKESLHHEGHSTALEVAQLAKDLEAAKLILVHLPPQLELHEAILSEAQSVFPQAHLPKGCSVITLH